jgi:hypothetical protein
MLARPMTLKGKKMFPVTHATALKSAVDRG